MFERYTDRANRCVALAQAEARQLCHPEVGPEHLLVGLAAEGEALAAQALAALGVTTAGLREALARTCPPRRDKPGATELSADFRKAAELALRESLQLGFPYVGTEHLLLAVMRLAADKPGSACAQVIALALPAPARVRASVMTLLRGHAGDSAEAAAGEADEGDPLALVLARLDGIARDVGAIRGHLAAEKRQAARRPPTADRGAGRRRAVIIVNSVTDHSGTRRLIRQPLRRYALR